MSVYHGVHRCTVGVHSSEGARMLAPRGEGGGHTPTPWMGRARLRPLGVGRGFMLGGGISYFLLFYFFTFRGLNLALGWLYYPIESNK
jgi:hypothetical protein